MASSAAGGAGVVWFKRDLRVVDHRPLAAAAERCHGGVVGLYIYEPIVLEAAEHDSRHHAFANGCLRELREALRERGTELVLARGSAVEVLERLRGSIGFTRLFSHEQTGLGATFARDLAVAGWAAAVGVEWAEFAQHGVFRPLESRDGWARRWRSRMAEQPAEPPRAIRPIPKAALERFGRGEILEPSGVVSASIQPGGSRAAGELLESFLFRRGRRYQSEMSSPVAGWVACSRLSPHLAYGSLSIRAAWRAAERRTRELRGEGGAAASDWRRSIASFEKRLRWHGHFIQKLEDEPEIEERNFSRAYDGMRTERPSDWSAAEVARFEASESARTGYPFVDACLRCLRETGWINFRMRAMLMSFASYHLWLHWKRPAAHRAGHY